MGPDESAYAVLGLEPGADLAAVERAYRSLIKAHHPDRAGGDAVRAADINRAYKEVRAALLHRDDVSLRSFPARKTPGWSATIWIIAVLAILGSAAAAFGLLSPHQAARIVGIGRKAAASAPRVDAMERPLELAVIDSATLEAVKMAQIADEMALSARSNQCYDELRREPDLARFDRCSAFDDAVVRLQDRDPMRDRGRFSEIAVTSRQWSAASMLSKDFVATDSRLRRIRLHVELLLSPDEPSSADP